MGLNPFSVLIIGCGQVAGGKPPAEGFDTDIMLTHAQAFSANDAFRLLACVDPDAAARNRYAKLWNIDNAYQSAGDAFGAHGSFDVVCICSPDHTHEAMALAAIDAGAKVVVLEKPAAGDAAGVARIAARAKSGGCHVLVNFPRRYTRGIAELQEKTAAGEYGTVRQAFGIYNKGLRHNGVHHIDLALYLFGGLALRTVGRSRTDHDPSDPTVDVSFDLPDGGSFHLVGTDCRDYAAFELNAYASKGAFAITDLGFQLDTRTIQESELFPGFTTLSTPVLRPSGFNMAFAEMALDVERCLLDGIAVRSGIQNSISGLQIIEQVHSQLGI